MAKQSSVLESADPRLAYAFEVAFPFAVKYRAENGKSATYDEFPAPPAAITPQKKNELGEPIPYVDSKGKPISAARLVLTAVRNKYHNKPNNTNANPVISARMFKLVNAVNAASGVKRGRGTGKKVTQTEVSQVEILAPENAEV